MNSFSQKLSLTLAATGSDGSTSSVNFTGGGPFQLSSSRWPEWFVYMQDTVGGNVRGCKGIPGTQGDLIFTPVKGNEDYYLISTVCWKDWYFYMENNSDGNVGGCKDDPGAKGYWKITPNSDGSFLLSPKEYPTWNMYMQNTATGNIRGYNGNPGSQAHFKFSCNVLMKTSSPQI